ncbi:hypothetical protein K490DRAFT_58007 [Saccharata proteae CBS 121410]|uniref:PEBP-like protein n=1 Tax=Saccharata proteae CBS 121410 TaxID=1314787 RepID=A0A9P4HR34_9PEZI|nr:hypothetical protein K490DRAFT_58007 [Saccharata proteae CBS 121410]
MRFSIISAVLPALALAAPQSLTARSSILSSTAPASIIPSELTDLINPSSSMLVTRDGLLGGAIANFGQFDQETGASTIDSSYPIAGSLLPPSLVQSLLYDFQLLVTEDGAKDVVNIVYGALTFNDLKKRETIEKRQVPITGPIGDFIAQAFGLLPISDAGPL